MLLTGLLSLVLAMAALAGTPSGTAAAADPGPDPETSAPAASLIPPEAYGRAHGRKGRNPDQPRMPRSCATFKEKVPQEARTCHLVPHKRGAPTIALWGDSHAWQMIPALRAAIGNQRVNLVGFIFGACPPMDPRLDSARERRRANPCQRTGDLALRWLRNAHRKDRTVRLVLATGWELYHNALAPPDRTDEKYEGYRSDVVTANAKKGRWGTPRALRTLGRLGVRTDVVGPMPMKPANARHCPRGNVPYRCWLDRRGALVDERINVRFIKKMQRHLRGVSQLVRPAEYMCGRARCRARRAGLPTFYDRLHLGARMSARLGPHYFGRTVDRVQAAHRRR